MLSWGDHGLAAVVVEGRGLVPDSDSELNPSTSIVSSSTPCVHHL